MRPDSTRPSDYWEKVAVDWQARHAHRLWRAHSDAVNLALLERWWPATPISRVLKTDLFDEVSGQGLLPFLSARVPDVHGIDFSAEIVSLAAPRLGAARATAADIRALPFRTDTFDLVVSNSTLDHFAHLDDLKRGLAELTRVLAPEGTLILTLDNLANPAIAVRNTLPFGLMHHTGLVPYFVGATCGPEDGKHLLRDAGLNVRSVDAILHVPRAIAVLAASACDRLKRPAIDRGFLSVARAFERAGRWPTRYRTGYFVAFLASKPGNR